MLLLVRGRGFLAAAKEVLHLEILKCCGSANEGRLQSVPSPATALRPDTAKRLDKGWAFFSLVVKAGG